MFKILLIDFILARFGSVFKCSIHYMCKLHTDRGSKHFFLLSFIVYPSRSTAGAEGLPHPAAAALEGTLFLIILLSPVI